MANRTPQTFTGTPTLTPEKIQTLIDYYKSALGDADHATDPDDGYYWEGTKDGLAEALSVLFDTEVQA